MPTDINTADIFCLDPSYSTTRLVTRETPNIENPPDAKFASVLFLPEGEGRKGKGGLRTNGYFKKSLSDKPLITVITVVFNGEKYLEETILSVINQTYDNVEYIIIDGGSTDGTVDIIKKYEGQLDYWLSESDNGIYDAMNKGLRLATGDYIHFLNAGDTFIFQKTLGKIANIIVSRTNGLIMFQVIASDKTNKYIFPKKNDVVDIRQLFHSAYCHQAAILKRQIYLDAGGFDTNFPNFADFKILVYARAHKSGFYEIPKPIVNFPLDGVSSSWIKAVTLYKEKEKLLQSLGFSVTTFSYYVGLIRTLFYREKMRIKVILGKTNVYI